jgi:hypothetical protein
VELGGRSTFHLAGVHVAAPASTSGPYVKARKSAQLRAATGRALQQRECRRQHYMMVYYEGRANSMGTLTKAQATLIVDRQYIPLARSSVAISGGIHPHPIRNPVFLISTSSRASYDPEEALESVACSATTLTSSAEAISFSTTLGICPRALMPTHLQACTPGQHTHAHAHRHTSRRG